MKNLRPIESRSTYFMAVVAVAAIAVAMFVVLRSSDGPEQASAAPASAPAAAGYIKFEGIPGEAKDSRHKDWIDILSFSYGISPLGGATGATRHRASATLGDIVVVKELDKSSPKLQEAAVTGQVIPTLELDVTNPRAPQSEPYLQWVLKDVIISSYRINGATSGDERPTETFALNYEEIRMVYIEADSADGTVAGPVEFSWKVEEGTK